MSIRCALLAVFLVSFGCSNSNDSGADNPGRPRDEQPGSPGSPPDEKSTSNAPSTPAPFGTCVGPPGKTVRTLIVGNSQIYYWNLPKLLSDLSLTAPAACPRIAAEGFTRGGQNLRDLWERGDSKGRNLELTIHEGKYDVVLISESIALVDFPPPKEPFVKYANLIIDAARASNAVPILYASPYADQAGHRGFPEMAEPQIALGLARSVNVAAAGLAWLRVWQQLPEIDLHASDHAHPGYNGSIISAMVIYAVISRVTPLVLDPKVPLDCTHDEGTFVGPEICPPVTAADGAVFQEAAWAEAMATGMK